MARRPRSPRAIQVQGGRWWRPPRPKLIARSRSPPCKEQHKEESSKLDDKASKRSEKFYTCRDDFHGDDSAALVQFASPVIQSLAVWDTGAAQIVQGLCDRLEEREGKVLKLERRLRKAKEQRDVAEDKVQAQEDLQGQSARHWWKVMRLKQQVTFLKSRNSHLSRKVWYLQHARPP